MRRYITYDWLKEQGACKPSLRKFRRKFQNGARVTLTNLRKADLNIVEWGWLSRALLPDAFYWRYVSAESLWNAIKTVNGGHRP